MKQRRENLPQLSVDLLETILQNAADGITVQDVKGNIIYANKVAATLSGFSSVEAFLNSSPQDIAKKFHLQDRLGNPYSLERLPGRRVLNGEVYAEATVRFHYPGSKKEQWSLIKATPLYQKDKKTVQYAINIFHDVTQQKKIQKDREIFFAIASHELKSLLTSIKAYTQLLQKRSIREADTTSYNFLHRLDTQIDKLTLLIVDLLDLSRIRAGKLQLTKEVFDLTVLVQTIIADMQITTQQKIILQGKVTKKILADKGRLTQVIINFLSNAIKYAPEGKEIIIQLKQEEKHCLLEVTDFGKGILKEEQKHIFKLFYQSKQKKHSSEEGLGIGLFISKAIITVHKGIIGVKSTPRGNTFFFRIPLKAR